YSTLRQVGADVVIVGSDQVWRSSFYSDRNLYLDMFLKFALKFSGLKIAYAASFGTGCWDVPEDESQVLQYLSSKFNAISTREASGVHLCRHYLKVEALHICDPTILLTQKDYMKLAEKSTDTNYLLGYLLDIDSETVKIIENIAEELELQVYIKGAENSAYISVERWLGLIEGATAIITNSFHGTVFSLITHTPFIVIVHEERGVERIYSLLDSLGLGERMIENIVDIKTYMLKEHNIDWGKIDEKLEEMRIVGKRFLEEALCGKTTIEIEQILSQETYIRQSKSNS
ncbi:MAG: polysaccharide pyruvyl transferase family protein, partial [Muribaculaceae bacterium]|nr:polysaccharide pyruvyl transferase family protein [Muribaculaceae bacterium]